MRPDIQTACGHSLSLVRPDPDCITIQAIAHALANTCRFGGHTSSFYSVAEHCVRVALSGYVPRWLQFDALMHDAAEAFVGDIPTPLKHLLPEFRAIERRIEAAIELKFGCYEMHHDLVKKADLVLLATERRDLMPDTHYRWEAIAGIEPLASPIHPLAPASAREMFLRAFKKYAPLDISQMAEREIAA